MAAGSTIRRRGARPVRLGQDLAAVLIAARGDRTRKVLADAAGVHPNVLQDLERGRANPTLAYLEAIGPVYGIQLEIIAAAAPE